MTPHRHVDNLKATVEEEGVAMTKAFMHKVCATFWGRMEAIVEAEGGEKEKIYNLQIIHKVYS